MFCEIPIKKLREGSIAELNLEAEGIGDPGALVLCKLIPTNTSLRNLDVSGWNRVTGKAAKRLVQAVLESEHMEVSLRSHSLAK